MSVQVREVREPELEECLELWCTVFHNDTPDYFRRYFYGDEYFEPKYTRVAVVNGRIVSAVHIVKRLVACGEHTFTMGGIANVATHPEARGRGYASLCLEQALEVMRGDGMDFSTLGTGIPGFYARYGWERAHRFVGTGRLRDRDVEPRTSTTVRRYNQHDEPAIRTIYRITNNTRPITVRRTAAYWREWIGWTGGKHPGDVLVAEDAQGVAAYCLATVEDAKLVVRELGDRTTDGAGTTDVLWACLRSGRMRGAEQVELRVPRLPTIEAVASQALTDWRYVLRETSMVRVLNPVAMVGGLLPELNDQWRALGRPQGTLSFSTPEGALTVVADSRGVRVEEGGSGDHGQLDLLQLITGFGPKRMTSRLADLFPDRPGAWYWDLDGF